MIFIYQATDLEGLKQTEQQMSCITCVRICNTFLRLFKQLRKCPSESLHLEHSVNGTAKGKKTSTARVQHSPGICHAIKLTWCGIPLTWLLLQILGLLLKRKYASFNTFSLLFNYYRSLHTPHYWFVNKGLSTFTTNCLPPRAPFKQVNSLIAWKIV